MDITDSPRVMQCSLPVCQSVCHSVSQCHKIHSICCTMTKNNTTRKLTTVWQKHCGNIRTIVTKKTSSDTHFSKSVLHKECKINWINKIKDCKNQLDHQRHRIMMVDVGFDIIDGWSTRGRNIDQEYQGSSDCRAHHGPVLKSFTLV